MCALNLQKAQCKQTLCGCTDTLTCHSVAQYARWVFPIRTVVLWDTLELESCSRKSYDSFSSCSHEHLYVKLSTFSGTKCRLKGFGCRCLSGRRPQRKKSRSRKHWEERSCFRKTSATKLWRQRSRQDLKREQHFQVIGTANTEKL